MNKIYSFLVPFPLSNLRPSICVGERAGKVKLKCSAILVGIISFFLSKSRISLLLSSDNAFHGEATI